MEIGYRRLDIGYRNCLGAGASGVIWGHLGASGVIWGHLGASGDVSGGIWGHLGTSGSVGDNLRCYCNAKTDVFEKWTICCMLFTSI